MAIQVGAIVRVSLNSHTKSLFPSYSHNYDGMLAKVSHIGKFDSNLLLCHTTRGELLVDRQEVSLVRK